jgi:hypothetical protein
MPCRISCTTMSRFHTTHAHLNATAAEVVVYLQAQQPFVRGSSLKPKQTHDMQQSKSIQAQIPKSKSHCVQQRTSISVLSKNGKCMSRGCQPTIGVFRTVGRHTSRSALCRDTCFHGSCCERGTTIFAGDNGLQKRGGGWTAPVTGGEVPAQAVVPQCPGWAPRAKPLGGAMNAAYCAGARQSSKTSRTKSGLKRNMLTKCA